MTVVCEFDKWLDGEELHFQLQHIPERAIGIWEAEKQVAVLIRFRCDNDSSIGEKDFEFLHRFVHKAHLNEDDSCDACDGPPNRID